jgi:branched-subunit amino acid aminotransferase/4-amino-4-deoxychorismate lyase
MRVLRVVGDPHRLLRPERNPRRLLRHADRLECLQKDLETTLRRRDISDMRYRITLDQVWEIYYVTVTTWEPDGTTISKSTRRYQVDAKTEGFNPLPVVLRRLSLELDASQF